MHLYSDCLRERILTEEATRVGLSNYVAGEWHTREEICSRVQQECAVNIDPKDHSLQEATKPQRVKPASFRNHNLQVADVQMVELRGAEHGLVTGQLGDCADKSVATQLRTGFFDEVLDGCIGLAFQVQQNLLDVRIPDFVLEYREMRGGGQKHNVERGIGRHNHRKPP